MPQPIPAIFAGEWSEPVLLRIGAGYDDDGEPYEMFAKSDAIAPGGPGGECIFTLLYLTTRHYDEDVSFWITPIIDGVALESTRIDLIGVASSQGELQSHEIGISVPYSVGGVEQMRTAGRGTWFQVLVETRYGSDGGVPADQIVEAAEVEYEVVRESMSPP